MASPFQMTHPSLRRYIAALYVPFVMSPCTTSSSDSRLLQANTAMGGGDPYPVLALNGDADAFFLCRTGAYANSQTSVVYKPSNASGSYIYASCYPVKLHLVKERY